MNKSKAETMESSQLTAPEGALEDAPRATRCDWHGSQLAGGSPAIAL